jgi:hypothetical protein
MLGAVVVFDRSPARLAHAALEITTIANASRAITGRMILVFILLEAREW